MATLSFNIEVDDWVGGEDQEKELSRWVQEQIQAYLHSEVVRTIDQAVRENIKEKVVEVMQQQLETLVETRFESILNEDVAFTVPDGYRTTKFVGTMEDYMAKLLIDKTSQPVDSNGRPLSGCTTETRTWLQNLVEQKIARHMESEGGKVYRALEAYVTRTLAARVTEDEKAILAKAVKKRMEQLGLLEKE